MNYYIYYENQRNIDDMIKQYNDAYKTIETIWISDQNCDITLSCVNRDTELYITKFSNVSPEMALRKINQYIALLICENLIFDN